MSAEKVRRLLGALLDDPENEAAWGALEEAAIGGEFATEAALVRGMLEAQRGLFTTHGEAEAAARSLDLEVLLTVTPTEQGPLLRERARVLEEELLDDRAAIAALDARLALGPDPEALESRDRLLSKKSRWKDIVAAYKRSAENDSTDPAMIASHLVSAAGIVLQYKPKGREKDADAIFKDALAVDPANVRAIQLYERVLRRRGNRWDELAEHLERSAAVVGQQDTRIDLLVRAARTHAGRRGDIAAAERIYREILSLRPADPQATRFVVAILTDRERWDDLAAFYESQLAAGGDRPDMGLLVQAGMTHWRTRNDPGRAAPFFVRLREHAPEHPAAVAFFAETHTGEEPEMKSSEEISTETSVDAPTVVPPAMHDGGGDEEVAITSGEDAEIDGALAAADGHTEELASDTQPESALPTADTTNARAVESTKTVEAVATTLTQSATVAPPAEEHKPVGAGEPQETEADTGRPSAPPSRPSRVSLAQGKPGVSRMQMALDLAQTAQESGQADRAIDAWKAVLRLDPSHTEGRAALLSLYATAGRWNNLVELYRQELDGLGGVRPGPELMSHKERKLELLREMVEIYRDKLGLEPMVVQTWNSILALEPGDLTALRALAQSYEKLGRYTDVIKSLDLQVENVEDKTEKISLLRQISQLWLERFNNVNNATRSLEQIVAIDQNDTEAITQLKELYTRRRAWRPLFEISRREAELLDGTVKRDALVELARLAAERLGANSEAIALWREALAIDAETPGALDSLEKLTERERDWPGLAEVLERRAVDATDSEQRAAVLMKLGAVYSERVDDQAKSVDAWRRVLEAQPKHPKAMRVLRDAYTAASQWDQLEALYADVADWEGLTDVLGSVADRASDPETKISLSFRAAKVFEDKLHQPERAFRNYERVLSVDPKNLSAARALEPIYTREEKWPRLAQLYSVLLDGLEHGDTSTALGYLHQLREISSTRLGDRPAAFRWALRAYELAPTDVEVSTALERSAADAGAWASLVEAYDARAAATTDQDEAARLRDRAAELEADKLDKLGDAIERYQSALKGAPSDGAVIAMLDGLLRRAGHHAALRDLYDHRLSLTHDPVAKRVLVGDVAELEEHELHDPDAASARFRKVIAEDPEDSDALIALCRLAESGGRWKELAQLLSTRRDRAAGESRAELAFRLGDVQLKHLGDTESAIASFREALSLVPHHAHTLTALETLLRDETWRGTAATILEPEFAASGENQKLAWALQVLFDGETDRDARRALGLRLAAVYSDQLDDARSGFGLLRSVLEAQPEAGDVLDTLTNLAIANGWANELAEVLGRIVDRSDVSGETRIAIARRAAVLHEERLGDAVAAEKFHRVVIDAGVIDAQAFGSLRSLYQRTERWPDLRALYRQWVDGVSDTEAKIGLLIEEARLVEEVLDQRSEAAAVYARVLELDPTHRDAALTLDRLLENLGRWEALAQHIGNTLSQPWVTDQTAHALRFRRGELRELQLGEPEGAFEDYAAVIAHEPGHEGARKGLSRLLEVPSLRKRVGATLEKLHESEGDSGAAELIEALRVRLEFTAEPSERSKIFQRIAELHELVLSDVKGACDASIEALLAEPSSVLLRDEMLRLSAAALQDSRAAETLETVAEDPRAVTAQVGVLKELANVYDERLIDPAKAERTWQRLLALAPGDTATVNTAAVALERLYRALQNPRGLVEALTLRAKNEDDQELRRTLFAQSGEILEFEVGDLAGAVAAQRERLIIDPTDREALQALARLYEKTSAWEDLVTVVQREAQLAGSESEQKALRVRAATVLEERVGDVSGAIAVYRDVVANFGPDRAVFSALARLYAQTAQWPELLSVLEQDLAATEESADRLGLIVRIAELQRTHTQALNAAVEGYRAALEIDSREVTSRAALEELLRSPEPGIGLAAARALDPVFQGDQAWEKLLGVLDRIAQDSDDSDERRVALARAAEVAEIGLGDPSRAFDRAAQSLRDGLCEDLAAQFAHVEGLARSARRHADLVKLLGEVGPEVLEPGLQRAVYMKVAEVAREDLGDRVTAREWYEKTLELQGDFKPALTALEGLHEERGEWDELLKVLVRETDLAQNDEERRGLLRRRAVVSEARKLDRPGAIGAWEDLLGMGHDAEAAGALERLYTQEGRWNDLAGLLEGQLTVEGADVTALHHRLGVVALRNLDDPERAAENFRAVLEREADHEETVAAIEDLGRRPGWSSRSAEMLEPVYRAKMDLPKLIAALEARIEDAEPVQKRELLVRLGAIYEENLGDLEKALETHARVFREEPSDRGEWEVLTRLARSLGRWDRLAGIYGAQVDETEVDDDTTAELAFRAGALLDEQVGDTKGARKYYHRALAFDPTRREVFAAVEGLLRREEAWTELLAVYRDAAERASEPEERKGFLFKVAQIDEEKLGDLPMAIGDLRAVLEVDPTDREAVSKLDALLVRTESWGELASLLEDRVIDAGDAEERAVLRFRLGRLRADRLGDPRGAIEAFREILDETRDHRPAIQALDGLATAHPELRLAVVEVLEPIYRELDDWKHLAGVLEVRLDASTDPIEQGGLLRELGRIREDRGNDPRGAFTAFSRAFAADPGDGEAREAVERIAAQNGLWDDLVQSYETALEATDDVLPRASILRSLAQTHDQRRGDPRAAIAAYNRLFEADDTQLDVLDQLEGLHVLLSDWEGHVEVLERKVSRSLDDDQRKFLLQTIGESQRDMLGNPEAAIVAFERALELDPSDAIALDALDGLYTQKNDHAALADVLQRRLEVEPDTELRRETATRLGGLWQTELHDDHRAVEAYRRALDEHPADPKAISSLEALYTRLEQWDELLQNLRTQAALAPDEATRSGFELRIGALLAGPLAEPEAALQAYREVLEVDAKNTTAITAVRALADRPELTLAAVEVLEPIYRSSSRWAELVEALELKLKNIDDPSAVLTELRALASVHEDGRGDRNAAFDTWRRAFGEDSSAGESLAELERLAGALDRWPELVTALETEARATMTPQVARDLAVRAAQLASESLGDPSRAIADYQFAIEQVGDDDTLLEALEKLFERSERWRDLHDVIERRLSLASGDSADALEVRLGELSAARFDDAHGALGAWRNVLERDPSNAKSLAGIERLIENTAVRSDVIEALESAYQRNDDAPGLAKLLELRIESAEIAAERVHLLDELARLREERLADPAGALRAVLDAFKIDPRDERFLLEAERLAPATGSWEPLRGLVETVLSTHDDLSPIDVAALDLRAAGWYREHLGDDAAAEARLTHALDAVPDSTEALEALEALQRVAGRERDLVGTLRRRAEVELDVTARAELLREAASLSEDKLDDTELAAELASLRVETDDADVDALEQLARLRRKQGRHAELAELLTRRARLLDDPIEAAKLRREVASLYAGELGDIDRAVDAWREVIDFDIHDTAARSALEGLLEATGRHRDLEETLRGRLDICVTSEERAAVRMRLARLAEGPLGDVSAAAEYLREVLEETPSHAEAGRELERIYTSERRWSDLAELFERRLDEQLATGDTAGELTTLVRIGALREQELGDRAAATELYERVLDRQPDHPGALAALARLAESDSQWERAIEMLGRAVALAPTGAEGAAMAVHLAELERSQGHDDAAAERSLRRALELDANCTAALDGLKSLAKSKGDDALLAEVTEREVAVVVDPKQKVLLLKNLAGLGRTALHDAARATGWLEQARALAPDDREVLLPLVELYGEVGRDAESLPIIEEIIASFGGRRSKELAQWQHRLGRAYEQLGDDPRALSLYDAAFKVDLTNVPILRDLGLLCLRTGDLDRAQKTFRALLLQRLDSTSGISKPDVYFYLGEALARAGDKPKAIAMLERAVESDREHTRAKTLLDELKG